MANKFMKIPSFGASAKRKKIETRSIGIDIREDVIAVVELDLSQNPIRMVAATVVEIEDGDKYTALRRAVSEQNLQGEAVVVSGRIGQTFAFASEYPEKKPTKIKLNQWAKIIAIDQEGQADIPEIRDKVVDVGAEDSTKKRVVSWCSESEAEEIAALVRSVGLTVKAIDVPILAWQRAFGLVDPRTSERAIASILDLSHERPLLYVFGDPVGIEKGLLSTSDAERMAEEITTTLREIRKRSLVANVDNIHIVGKGPRNSSDFVSKLIAHLSEQDEGLTAYELSVGEKANPDWAFANALATWDHPSAANLRADLRPNAGIGTEIFGYSVGTKDAYPAAAAVVAAILGYGLGMVALTAQVSGINSEDARVQTEIATIAPRISRIDDLRIGTEKLREIDKDAYWLRYSGRLEALRLVQLGNSIPPSARANTITQNDTGWLISGRAAHPEALSETQKRMTAMSPGLNVRMQDEEQEGDSYQFNMRISDPPSPAPRPPVTLPVAPDRGIK